MSAVLVCGICLCDFHSQIWTWHLATCIPGRVIYVQQK